MTQHNLFDIDPEPTVIGPCDPSVTPAEAPRLSRQCQAILERLRRGRASNRELATLALKYTGRCSDLRAAGYDVRVVEENKASGLHVYALFVNGEEVK